MAGDKSSVSAAKFYGVMKSQPRYAYILSMPPMRRSVSPVFTSPVLSSSLGGFAFATSSASPDPSNLETSSSSHKLPPPVNPRETVNPDSATLKEQWRYATRMYSRWYAHAWGTAILAGVSFYALGWLIKGENPLLSGTQEKKEER